MSQRVIAITGTSPAAAGRAVISKSVQGWDDFDQITVLAQLVGATGGTLDIYLQRNVATDVWVDWMHFPQLAAAAAAVKYHASALPPATAAPVVIGVSADDVTAGNAPVLAANTVCAGHPGNEIRVVAVAGASTSAGAAVDVRIVGTRSLR
jgi:hypothetical protein